MKRILEIDAARGFTVLIMPAVHTVMLYSSLSIHHSVLGYLLAFIAEGPGAQLFMFLMGFSMVMSRDKSNKSILTRSASLFIAGYLLNFLRLVLPFETGAIPITLVIEYGINPFKRGAATHLLMIGDILQFAAMANLIIAYIKRSRFSVLFSVSLYLVVVFLSPFVWGIKSDTTWLDPFLALINDKGHHAFFPLFPWLCYPLAGLVAGRFYQNFPPKMFYKIVFVVGVVLLGLGACLAHVTPVAWDLDFYRSGPGRSIYQTGFVLIWLCGMKALVKWFPDNLFTRLLIFCSKHITSIYILQWIIIGWGLGIAGYHKLNFPSTVAAILVTSSLTFVTVWSVHRSKKADINQKIVY